MYRKITKCRICGNKNLIPLVDLGVQSLTGVFPKNKTEKIGRGPLQLVKCEDDGTNKTCGLVQLGHNYHLPDLYGDNYGYRSGLNKSMVRHLKSIVHNVVKTMPLEKGDIIIDIGSNDSTLLQAYPKKELVLLGVDPSGKKFKQFYPDHIKLIADFFPSNSLNRVLGKKKAKVITSIAMFYDLEDPIAFMQSVYDALDDNGVWVFEQSYMPSMLAVNAYDTICHEHLEYYSLNQINFMAERVGFKIQDVIFNNANGGSFRVTVSKKQSKHKGNEDLVRQVLGDEKKKKLHTLKPFVAFEKNIVRHRNALLKFLQSNLKEGKTILGYGASTKGNVILQYCGLSVKEIPFIAEVNEDKFGKFTPGTYIPIISEKEARKINPHYFVVLPWHFKENIIQREKKYLAKGGKLFFPLPELTVI